MVQFLLSARTNRADLEHDHRGASELDSLALGYLLGLVTLTTLHDAGDSLWKAALVGSAGGDCHTSRVFW
ncbi:MAG: hypothetical protein U0521_02000 [Anaerolineae bacterium]